MLREPGTEDHRQVGKVDLPELIGGGGWMGKAVGCLHQDEGRAGDQIVRLQEPIDRGSRDTVALLVDEGDRQLPRRQRRFFERELNASTTVSGSLFQTRRGDGWEFSRAPGAARQIALVPDVEGEARDAELGQRAPHRQRGLLDQPDDLQLLGGRVSHISDSQSPSTLFSAGGSSPSARPVAP